MRNGGNGSVQSGLTCAHRPLAMMKTKANARASMTLSLCNSFVIFISALDVARLGSGRDIHGRDKSAFGQPALAHPTSFHRAGAVPFLAAEAAHRHRALSRDPASQRGRPDEIRRQLYGVRDGG